MGQNKRYYWLKLHEEFFRQPSIKYIRTLPEGEKILIIYLKLLLVSLRTDGIIFMESLYPTMEEELALVLDENKMTVQLSLMALEKINLLERGEDDSELIMTKLPDMIGIGSENASAQRVRAYRERKALEMTGEKPESVTLKRECNTSVTDVKRLCNAEKEIEKEKKADPDKDAEKEAHLLYGVNRNVSLSDMEYESLKRQFPTDYMDKIDYFSSYMAKTGRSYDSHYLTICQWAKQDSQRERRSGKKKGFEDYHFEKGESY
ncbi:MAG: phage replisome organizer N-terminal domain-containing protein [Clostridiales bacterium]|nr:phage replisome organizer N-terminal domain-containing protein [Clostridiales bacterium]